MKEEIKALVRELYTIIAYMEQNEPSSNATSKLHEIRVKLRGLGDKLP